MFGGLKDVERYEKQFKEATLPYRNAVNNVNEAKAKYHQDTDWNKFRGILYDKELFMTIVS